MGKQLFTEEQVVKEKIWTRDFILICVANFFIFLGFQMTLPTIPLFVEHLGGNDQLIGLVVGIFTFSALLLRPLAGHALESKGRRIVYMSGLAIFVVSVGTFGFATSIIFLFFLRVIQGVGWGFSTTASGTVATDVIPASRRGEGLGYYGLSGSLALALGPALGLVLTGFVSYEVLFLLCALLGLLAFLLAGKINYKAVENRNVPKQKYKWDVYEKSALPPSILLLFITVTFGGISTFLPLYSAQEGVAGIELYFLIYAVFLMVSRTFAGKLYDKKGHKVVFIPGAVLILLAMLLLAWMANSMILFLAAIFYGLGFGLVQPALQAWSVAKAAPNRKGMANATFFSFFDLGIGIGAITFGQIGYAWGYVSIYVTSAFSVLIAIMFYLFFLWKEQQKNLKNPRQL
ncbi:MFS transporter [Bacillus sp. B15-48]|uniref:MFS transporter n=1 Tax=Bacillus sp. B15-48 TaxID=1548601 RepID=UPI00193F6781|nr:MFS transporter [Bacillus sp. B15-48]MBM4760689.1 MFS transporter [Bacillus sp. B15-48]